jgi:ribosomal-protein-alanine N-acetyltransferase
VSWFSRANGWPVTLSAPLPGEPTSIVELRPLSWRDATAWVEIRVRGEHWLAPWEASPVVGVALPPWPQRQTRAAFGLALRRMRQEARAGLALPWAVAYRDVFVGQLTVGTILRGALNSAFLGYWLDERVAGRGIAPTAIALAVDYCFAPPVALHRIEADVQPDNTASRRALEKLGFRQEGRHERLLAVEGSYRDHLSYALTAEEVTGSVLARWRERAAQADRAAAPAGEPAPRPGRDTPRDTPL